MKAEVFTFIPVYGAAVDDEGRRRAHLFVLSSPQKPKTSYFSSPCVFFFVSSTIFFCSFARISTAAAQIPNHKNELLGSPLRLIVVSSQVSASQKRMERQAAEAERLANSWYDRAQLALQNGDEELAREALARRQQQVLCNVQNVHVGKANRRPVLRAFLDMELFEELQNIYVGMFRKRRFGLRVCFSFREGILNALLGFFCCSVDYNGPKGPNLA